MLKTYTLSTVVGGAQKAGKRIFSLDAL